MGLVSPNTLHEAACRMELGGREPKTTDEWILCVNFWAFNVAHEARVELTVLLARIMSCPLPESVVREIAEFHAKKGD